MPYVSRSTSRSGACLTQKPCAAFAFWAARGSCAHESHMQWLRAPISRVAEAAERWARFSVGLTVVSDGGCLSAESARFAVYGSSVPLLRCCFDPEADSYDQKAAHRT